jgi:phosphatidylserine/phosphatidylglycerophosphate/cardiolipin synthase-like enzyme
MHFQYLYDEKINNLLIEKAKNNIKIEIILRADSYKNNIKEIESLKNNNIKIKFLKKPINHSKAILIDSKYLFI